MSLARRGVPFPNYGRAYVEGIEAVGSHTYLRQADATMSAFLDIHRRIAERSEPSPALSTLVLAAADEFSHAEGVSAPDGKSEHCGRRELSPLPDAPRPDADGARMARALARGFRGLRPRGVPALSRLLDSLAAGRDPLPSRPHGLRGAGEGGCRNGGALSRAAPASHREASPLHRSGSRGDDRELEGATASGKRARAAARTLEAFHEAGSIGHGWGRESPLVVAKAP